MECNCISSAKLRACSIATAQRCIFSGTGVITARMREMAQVSKMYAPT